MGSGELTRQPFIELNGLCQDNAMGIGLFAAPLPTMQPSSSVPTDDNSPPLGVSDGLFAL